MSEALGALEAPTFRPSAEEWKDPMAYIAFVRRHAEAAGIAKIIPPEGWDPPFAIDKRRLKLPTKVLSVHQLQSKDTSAAVKQFWQAYNGFMDASGSKLKKKPTFVGQEIDLYRLYRLVTKRGGFAAVTEERGWKDIVTGLQITDKGGNAGYTVKSHYQRLLLPYEDHCRAHTNGGAGLLAAAMEAEQSEGRSEFAELPEDTIDDDEAAEILEAMLGLAPAVVQAAEPPKKRRKSTTRDPASTQAGIKIPENIFTMVCEKCKGGHYEDKIILCDRCDKGWHMFCLSPPLETVPEGEWVCPSCIAYELEGEATRKGDVYSLEEMERMAAAFERQWFGSDAQAAAASLAERESEFWRVVEEGEDVVEVMTAADLDTSKYSSGFPRAVAGKSNENPYAVHPWNLANIPQAGGEHANLLRLLETHVPGLTAPVLTASMLFSAFAWRVQAHELYGLDYLHYGAPRRHYAVPAHAAALFEGALRTALPPQLGRQPEVLFRIHSLLAPRILASAGVPMTCITQEPGTFVVTFPNAYHAGISLGSNVSETVSFGPPDWLRYGAMSVSKYRHFRKPCDFSHERLVVRSAVAALAVPESDGNNEDGVDQRPGPRSCHWVGQELKRVVDEERVMRAKLWSEGLVRSRRVEQSVGMDEFGGGNDSECVICRLPLHLSAIECDCCSRRRTCLHHAANLCECPMRLRRLAWRHTLRELDAMVEGVRARVPAGLAGQIIGEEGEVQAAVDAAAEECAAAAAAVAAEQVDAGSPAQANGAVKKEEPLGDVAAAVVEPKPEELADLEALAGFMTVMGAVQEDDIKDVDMIEGGTSSGGTSTAAGGGAMTRSATLIGQKRRRESFPTPDAATLTLVTGNGFVQGPVRPFQTLDVYPEDRDAADEWLRDLQKSCSTWLERAKQALEQGGGMAADLSDLVGEAEQYWWGGVSAEEEAAVRELQPRLADAEDYMAAVNASLRGKPSLEAVEALLNQEPKPLANPPGLDQLQEAAAAARDWLDRSAKLAAPDAPAIDIRTLEAAVNEASRLPLALPEAKALRERLNMARKVGDAIRAALPTAREAGRRKKDEAAITVDYLQSLAVQAGAARVDMPEVANLTSALERIGAWMERVTELTGVRAHLSDLKALLEEADSLPAVLPDADHLRSLCERADAWLRHMQNLVRTRAPLKKLRDQLHAGLRLPVEVPEVEELRQDIRRREWEETARKAANTKGTLHALLEVLSTAADMGADSSALAANLQAKVDAAASWEQGAAAFVARFAPSGGAPGTNGAACPEEQRPELDELAEIVGAGTATGVRMERLQYLTNQLQAANKWLARAKECIPPPPPPPPPPLPQVDEGNGAPEADGAAPMDTDGVAAAGENGPEEAPKGLDALSLALALESAAAAAEVKRGPGRKPAPKPAPPAKPLLPQYEVVAALLTEYDEKLVIKAEEAAGLRTLVAAANGWLEEARPVLEQDYVVDEQLPMLNELIAKGKATGVSMEQVEILEANVEALLWGQTVRGLLEKLPPLPEAPELPEGGENGPNGTGTGTSEPPTVVTIVPPPVTRVTRAGEAAAEDDDQPLEGLPPADLSPLSEGVPPPDPDPSASEDDERPIPSTPYDQRPSLANMMTLLDEGGILPCDEALFAKFKRYVEAGQEWERAARAVLAVSKEGAPLSLVNIRQLRKLITRGERLALRIPALPRLHEVLRAHEKWEQRVRDLMSSAGARPAFAELQVFQQTARLNPVTSNLRRHIDAAVHAVEVWKERCRRCIAKRNTGMRLDRCFEVLGHSIDCAVEQFERRLEVEKRLVAAGPRRPGPGPDGEEDERELYCLCQQPYNIDTTMISCDLCGEWYHMRCVGVTQTQARSLRKYTCPICAAVRNLMDPLEYALGKLRRTRRPTREDLGTLLTEVRALPVTVEEETSLERLLVKFDRWATATSRAVEVHETSRKKDSGGQVLPLSEGMLHQLCKSALALELDGTDHAERILHLLRCNRWRARVDAVLGATSSAPGGKASAEAVAKLLLEAERLEVDAPADVAGARLLAAADATRTWQESVRTCIADLKAAGGAANPAFNAAVERAKELVKSAEKLPIRVEREVEKLQEYAKPYCLCRRAYDEQIPMLECDQCGEWFHFECVGLRSQGSATKDGAEEGQAGTGTAANGASTEPDQVIENFSCPLCCMRSSSKYPFYHKLPQGSLDALKEAAQSMPPAPPTMPGMHPQAAAAAAAAAAQMAMYPQGAWPFAMAAAQRGMMPGMVNAQALASMMEASFPNGLVPGMMPGLVHPAMFGFAGMHPAMAQAMQQQAQHQAAAIAQHQAAAAVANANAAAQQQAAAASVKAEVKPEGSKSGAVVGEQDDTDTVVAPRSGVEDGGPDGEDEIIDIVQGGSGSGPMDESELIDIEQPTGAEEGKGEDAPIDIT